MDGVIDGKGFGVKLSVRSQGICLRVKVEAKFVPESVLGSGGTA
jgi:hypothetical protein